MYEEVTTKSFRKAINRLNRSGDFDREAFVKVVEILKTSKSLPAIYHDHGLKGDWAGYNECHIKGDLLLIYKINNELMTLTLVEMGTHAQLFGR